MYRLPTFLALAFALTLTACDSDPVDVNPEELITEVAISLTNTADASDSVTITASDPDGDGAGLTFSPESIALTPGATYTGSIELRDTINNVDITAEVEGEVEEHLFRYTLAPSSAGTTSITDTESDYTMEDGNGGDFAVGLAFQVAVNGGATGVGTLNAMLFHFDEGPKTSSTATSDEIDIDIDFPVSFGTVTTAR